MTSALAPKPKVERRILGFALIALIAAPLAAQSVMEQRAALSHAQRDAATAAERAARYEQAAARATDAAARARRAQVAAAARIQSAEADIAAARARLRLIDLLRARHRARLAVVQAPIVRLTAALQTLARRPAALALVQPGSIDDIIHVRALLAAGLPEIRARSVGVRRELAIADRLRGAADRATAALLAGRDRLRAERVALTRAEATARARSAQLADAAMFEQDRALALGEQARDIATLMDRLDAQASRRERLAALPGPIPRPVVPGLAPPPATVAAIPIRPPRYRLPVVGRVLAGLGEVSDAGVRARGLTLSTAPQAQVVAPAGGRIAFAGPFRGYGRIVIVDHGGGWTTLLTGLASDTVAVGDRVDAGSPLGTTPAARPIVTLELRHDGRPVDITPLLGG
ncbi:MAG TPA: peptidoglycan DD-metalloendopeptidase family protein [Sphingomonas sp.]|jgi:murein DD-endopeptidase MepM/ murein hydrolase activator NlpD|uniref:murein hydrolase activator EnvC family protein n=1 Tax=Sphingomonas sp. TaxID=28214 RepID=UPI002EDB0465